MFKRVFLYFSLAVFLLAASVFCRFFAERGVAQPQHVRGSANVAACSYTNSCGSFIVWTDGRISSLKGEIVNEASQYGAAPGYKLPARTAGQCLGSQNVAAAAFVNTEGSYVVFADGTVKRPKNASAGAGSFSCRLLSGRLFADGNSVRPAQEIAGYGGRFTRTYLNGGASGKKVRITFAEPFAKKPLIFIADENGASGSNKGIAASYSLSDISIEGFTFSYQGNNSLIGTTGTSGFIFMASGE
ncbi:hypothetical protein IJT93_12825 [bacterium]|nr:hypothetical protein [bacterium]